MTANPTNVVDYDARLRELLEAAEITVAAAAAAAGWAGVDAEGVLSYVASLSPLAMAQSRVYYEFDQRHVRAYTRYDFEHGFEVAALPATAAPTWASRVESARVCAKSEVGIYAIPRWSALEACALWTSDDSLLLNTFHQISEVVEGFTQGLMARELQL